MRRERSWIGITMSLGKDRFFLELQEHDIPELRAHQQAPYWIWDRATRQIMSLPMMYIISKKQIGATRILCWLSKPAVC